MKNRVVELFAKQKSNLLSVFYTAGFPTPDSTVEIAKALQDAGVDIIEIGIPFSDPIADGPVIQESNKIALDQGMTLKKLLEQVKQIRTEVSLPVLLMGYLNPIMQYGIEKFLKDAKAAGVDGVILPDLPLDEFNEAYKPLFDQYQLTNTFLISPTTSESRIRAIDDATTGFIYAVSSSSTTGAKNDFNDAQESYFSKLQQMKLKNSFLIGFGISNNTTFQKAARYSSGAIVGSSFISMIKESKNVSSDVAQFVKSIKG